MNLTSEQFIEQIGDIEFLGPLIGRNIRFECIVTFLNFISDNNEILFKRFENICTKQLADHPIQTYPNTAVTNTELLMSLLAKIANHMLKCVPNDLMQQAFQSDECRTEGSLAVISILNSLDSNEKAIIQDDGARMTDEIFSEIEEDMGIENRVLACR